MSELRNQLIAAKREYENLSYPGDLADLLPPVERGQSWRLSFAPIALAAAAALVLFALAQFAMVFEPPASATALATGKTDFIRVEWTGDEQNPAPRIAIQAPAIAMPPSPASPLLIEARKPVVSCGQYIVNVGKDLAHQAGALLGSM